MVNLNHLDILLASHIISFQRQKVKEKLNCILELINTLDETLQ